MGYQSEMADSMESFVRKTYSLSAKAKHMYAGIRWLERSRIGLCKPVYAGYRELSEEASIDVKSVKAALLELRAEGLIELVIGSPIKSRKQATRIRRRTLDELKVASMQGDDDAHVLARALSERAFRFGENEIRPCWTVGHTGRVCSSKPNIQGKKCEERLAGLKVGLQHGQVLIHADIKQAEPSIIKHLLKIPQERDLYRQYMDSTNRPRNEAKKAINSLSYCSDTLACFAHWPDAAKAVLDDYVHRLALYKARLFAESHKNRSVTTVIGRSIAAQKGDRLHAGKVMNWRVQGTVADIVNSACLGLLDFASVLVPHHDTIYAILPADQVGTVEERIIAKAREVGLPLQVKADIIPPVKLYPKPPQGNTPQNPISCTQNRHPLPPDRGWAELIDEIRGE